MGVGAGQVIHDERVRRRWSIAVLANRAGISIAHTAQVEGGKPASLETYARLMTALGLAPELTGLAPGRRENNRRADEDFVHAAMAEVQARRFQSFGIPVRIDEPYQHYQFAGRADVVAWDVARRALLHIENRTRFPNVQEAVGSFGAKRTYFGPVLAERLGLRAGWATETHVMLALWSSEVLHAVRLRETTFRVTCPDRIDPLLAWWNADLERVGGSTSSIALFDPAPGVRPTYRIGELTASTRPRYPGYADAADALRGS